MQHIRVSFLYFGSKIQASIVKIYIKKKKKKKQDECTVELDKHAGCFNNY